MSTVEQNLVPPSELEIQVDKRNGRGYWSYLPTPAAPLDETLSVMGDYGNFTEMPEIIRRVDQEGSLLVTGAAGSGKSHLVRDLQAAAVINSVPLFQLALHINSGLRNGTELIRPRIDEFVDKAHETGGGVVVIENVDILGYKGKSKSRTRTAEFAQLAQPMLEELIDDPDLVVIGVAHDDDWREGRWTWDDPAIDDPASQVLELFTGQYDFRGRMALVGLAHILRERSFADAGEKPAVTLGQAAQVIRLLHKSGRADFFHANHVDIKTFLRNPAAAVEEIEQGRAERNGKA